MFRFLAPVFGHAKLLACAGLAAGSVAVAPTAVRAWHNHHQSQTQTRQVAYDTHHQNFDQRGDYNHRDFNTHDYDHRDTTYNTHDYHPAPRPDHHHS